MLSFCILCFVCLFVLFHVVFLSFFPSFLSILLFYGCVFLGNGGGGGTWFPPSLLILQHLRMAVQVQWDGTTNSQNTLKDLVPDLPLAHSPLFDWNLNPSSLCP